MENYKVTALQEVLEKLEPTPGPWRAYESVLGDGYIILGSNEHGGEVYPVLARTFNWPLQSKANARLISAAPEYHTAAHKFRDAVLHDRHQLEATLDNDQTNAVLSLFDEVFAVAIAKATGK